MSGLFGVQEFGVGIIPRSYDFVYFNRSDGGKLLFSAAFLMARTMTLLFFVSPGDDTLIFFVDGCMNTVSATILLKCGPG